MSSSQAKQTETGQAPTPGSEVLATGQRLSLEEMSRIMDVAAALRKERALVNEQLNIDQIKAKLRERLLEAAKISGNPVTAEEVDAAVRQYYQQLHEFREPAAGFATFLAHVWVLRAGIFKWLLSLAGVALAFVLFNAVQLARQTALASALYGESYYARAQILSFDDAAPLKRDLDAKVASAKEADRNRDFDTLNRIKSELLAIQAEYESQYTVQILSDPNSRSITERNWNDEQGQRTSGFYAIVEARDARGNAVQVPVHNRETDRTEMVSRWGEQVPEAVFDRLAADKKADGVVDEREFGVKRRGTREFEVQLKGADGQPLPRGGQITSWE